jgi:hypothetical protein
MPAKQDPFFLIKLLMIGDSGECAFGLRSLG